MKKFMWLNLLFSVVLFVLITSVVSTQASSEPKKIYRVEARTTTFGGSSYILGFAASDLLNKKSSWVRGSVLESTGTPENIKMVGQDPKKRKRTFFTCTAEMFEIAKAGQPPFDEKAELYKDLMIMANQQELASQMITLDPNIRTLADLKGKKVSTWPRGTTKYDLTYKLIAGAGKDVVDSIKWQYTAYGGYDDMILGKVDAAYSFCPERGSGIYTTVPKLRELMSKRKVYFVTATPEMRRNSMKLFGTAYGSTSIMPAGCLGSGTPRQDVIGFNIVIGWGIYPEMPEDVVYEILRVLDENHEMVKEYHSAGKGWIPSKYGTYPAEKKYWHPGARKYFDDKGIRYGKEYFFEVYPMKLGK